MYVFGFYTVSEKCAGFVITDSIEDAIYQWLDKFALYPEHNHYVVESNHKHPLLIWYVPKGNYRWSIHIDNFQSGRVYFID